MQINDLSLAELNYWVGKAAGLNVEHREKNGLKIAYIKGHTFAFNPCVAWADAGNIISKFKVSNNGDLPAAMRSFVQSVYGESVPIT